MNVEEKILRYLHSKFPRPIVFGFSGISIEKFGLNPDTDPLEFDRTFDLLKEQYYIAQNRGIITITFDGICYFEEKYLKPNYHYLKIFKTILESLERLENGEYPNNMISNKEIIKRFPKVYLKFNDTYYLVINNHSGEFSYTFYNLPANEAGYSYQWLAKAYDELGLYDE